MREEGWREGDVAGWGSVDADYWLCTIERRKEGCDKITTEITASMHDRRRQSWQGKET